MPPKADGVLIIRRDVFILCENFNSFSLSLGFIHKTDVCPKPPLLCRSVSAISSAFIGNIKARHFCDSYGALTDDFRV